MTITPREAIEVLKELTPEHRKKVEQMISRARYTKKEANDYEDGWHPSKEIVTEDYEWYKITLGEY